MDKHLKKGGNVLRIKQNNSKIVHVKKWIRKPKRMIIALNNGTFKVDMFHSNIIISQNLELCLSLNSEQSTYFIKDIRQFSCDEMLGDRLTFALSVLKEFAETDTK
jgi:hypothetical protein